jgi:hypothetical protein
MGPIVAMAFVPIQILNSFQCPHLAALDSMGGHWRRQLFWPFFCLLAFSCFCFSFACYFSIGEKLQQIHLGRELEELVK